MTSRTRPIRPRHAPREAVPPGVPPLSLRHPAWWLALTVCAGCIAVSVSNVLFEWDFWLHLTVGREIWANHAVPTRMLWAWPTYGRPDINSSWGFEALVWPFYAAAGLWGLFVWRWLTTLAAFTFLWLAARRTGARGFIVLPVLVLCALTWRQRAQIRSETLVAVLLAIEIWLLECRRHGRGRHAYAVAPLLWVWANVHISAVIGFFVLGAHLLDEWLRTAKVGGFAHAEGAGTKRPGELALVALVALALAFVNPFGWRALVEPFQMFLLLRPEPMMRDIPELSPVWWTFNLRNGLFLLLLGWPALALWRARRRGWDAAELSIAVLFTLLSIEVRRFAGFYVIAAAPYVARDLNEWLRAHPVTTRPRGAWGRAAAAALVCVAISIPEWTRPGGRFGRLLEWAHYPVAAADFIERHDIRGRAFNTFYLGSYLVWRWWPERDRLPYMNTKPENLTPELRDMYRQAIADTAAWKRLDRRFGFAFAVARHDRDDPLPSVLDADSAWSLVFMDDAALVYVRKQGSFAPIAARLGYRFVPGSFRALNRVGADCGSDTVLRRRVRGELERSARESRFSSLAQSLLANIALLDGRLDDARRDLESALAIEPRTGRAHERLGMIALAEGKPREALKHYRQERRVRDGSAPSLAPRMREARDSLDAQTRRGR